jgi:hypothetical protein
MVLDAKALAWAAQHEIDTAKLKRAKVPIYGKWYFPEIPAGVPLISLQSGERRTFDERMLAGEVIWVAEDDLKRAGLLPAEAPPTAAEEPSAGAPTAVAERPPGVESSTSLAVPTEEAPEPFLAMSRPPGVEQHTPGTLSLPLEEEEELPDVVAEPLPAGIHLPSPSIGPFILAIGFSLVFLGLITHVLILITGLLWMLVGAIVWIRVNMFEDPAMHGHEPEVAP